MKSSLAFGFVLALTVSASATASTVELPGLTVYPDPTALQLDRLSRQIIRELPSAAELPVLRPPAQSCNRCGDAPQQSGQKPLRLS